MCMVLHLPMGEAWRSGAGIGGGGAGGGRGGTLGGKATRHPRATTGAILGRAVFLEVEKLF